MRNRAWALPRAVRGAFVLGALVLLAAALTGRDAQVAAAARTAAPLHVFRTSGYEPQQVPDSLLPGFRPYAIALDEPSRPTDADGVALYQLGSRLVYHPLVIARYGIDLLNGYRINNDPAYLDRAEINARYLRTIAVSRADALFLPYRFVDELFGDRTDLMRPPWYSALTQGTALSLYVRLWQLTGEEEWKTDADGIFESFLEPQSRSAPWTVFVDRSNCLWFEEYAKYPVTQVLNGHIYAIFGVWEYALATGDPVARKVFDGGATTVKREIDLFRVPGRYSYYSLRRKVEYASYHDVVTGQLQTLAAMTGDGFFAREAHLFTLDAQKAKHH